MIQYYRDLESQVKSIQARDLVGGQIQKLYSTAYLVSLSIRVPGKTWSLYLGRGAGVEGVWLAESPPPAALRRKDHFLEYLRRHLSSCTFLGIELDSSDRILRLNYQKYGERQSFFFFWKARKVYFLHHYKEAPETPWKLLLSWRNKAQVLSEDIDLLGCFDEIGRRADLQHDFRAPRILEVQEILAQEVSAAGQKTGQSRQSFLQRKKTRISQDLVKVRQWENIQQVLRDGASLEETNELEIGDHRFRFHGELNAYERRNLLFEKIKKLKKGETILQGRLDEVSEILAEKKERPETRELLPITRIAWGDESATLKVPEKEEGQEFLVYKLPQLQLGVGKSARGNDQLRSKWAGKEDLWLHLDGLKSAHVIIKMNAGIPGNEELNLAASILARFSHFTGDWIPVIYTQVKNLKGVSGVAGMVTYKKERHLRCPRVDTSLLVED